MLQIRPFFSFFVRPLGGGHGPPWSRLCAVDMAACSAVKGAGELAWLHVGIGLKISLGYDFVAVNISQNPAVTAWYP